MKNSHILSNMASIEDLPEELLEHIFSLLSPYKDLKSCKFVCKKWHIAMKRVVRRRQNDLYRAIRSNTIHWESQTALRISLRHSHAACYVDGVMYVFGGCSFADTTFNDLLALDLDLREFSRVSVKGSMPSPKACASLCSHKEKLILFGGWAYPSRLAPFQPLILFNELHVFDLASKTWTSHGSNNTTPTFASHSATVHEDTMIVFGGITGGPLINWSNSVSCLDLNTMKWSFPVCSNEKPPPRFGQSQIYLDESHLLIIGGSKCSGFPRLSCDDVWILYMDKTPWTWKQVTVLNPQWAAPHLWCHPVVKIGDVVVVFSRCASDNDDVASQADEDTKKEKEPKEENVNGKHGCFNGANTSNHTNTEDRQDYSTLFNHSKQGDRGTRRKRQLEALAKFEKKFGNEGKKKENDVGYSPKMNLYVANIADIIESRTLTWLPPRYSSSNPFDRILYSLVVGNSELIMLGGMASDGETGAISLPKIVQYNPLRFAMAPRNYL